MTGASGAGVSTVLDEAYDRMHYSGFELPNGFVNHGPMACEALAVLGCEDEIDSWARRPVSSPGTAVAPVAPRVFEWSDAVGVYERLGEWIGYFEARIADDGWPTVVKEWVPRLIPGLAVALFHGEIRVAHAVRAASAGRYLARPDIFNLHGVTGAMGLALLVPHLTDSGAQLGFAQLRADHAAFYGDANATGSMSSSSFPVNELAAVAAASGDPHQVQLVEACKRAFESTGDAVFAAAAATVTGLT